MNVGIAVGTRFPAYATSMGRVLLAALPPAELKAYLAAAEIKPLTPRALGTSRNCSQSWTLSAHRAGACWTRSWNLG